MKPKLSDDRSMRYVDVVDGEPIVVWRASSLGACDRAIVAAANGYSRAPKPPWFQKVLDEGTEFENTIDRMWSEQTGINTCNQQAEFTLQVGVTKIAGEPVAVAVRGHIDGDNGDSVLREFKKFRDSTWDNFVKNGVNVNKNYPWQVSAYMLGHECASVEFVGGHLVFDLDDDGEPIEGTARITEVHEHVYDAPPHGLREIRKRIMAVEKLIAEGFDPAEISCEKTMYPCPYYELHDPEPDAVVVANPEAVRLVEIIATAGREVKKFTGKIKSHEKKKRDAASELRELLAAEGDEINEAKLLIVDGIEVTRVRSTVPSRTTKPYELDYFKIKE